MEQTPASPPPTHQTHVHIAQPQTNGLGVAGFVISLIGFVSCGFVCPIGAIISAFALKKEPKGMAIAGLIIGIIGSIVPVVILIFFGSLFTAILAAIGMGTAAIAEHQAQQNASKPAAQAIYTYHETHQALPDETTAIGLLAGFAHEGSAFRFAQDTNGLNDFILSHPGPDQQWNTADDWAIAWSLFELNPLTPVETAPQDLETPSSTPLKTDELNDHIDTPPLSQ